MRKTCCKQRLRQRLQLSVWLELTQRSACVITIALSAECEPCGSSSSDGIAGQPGWLTDNGSSRDMMKYTWFRSVSDSDGPRLLQKLRAQCEMVGAPFGRRCREEIDDARHTFLVADRFRSPRQEFASSLRVFTLKSIVEVTLWTLEQLSSRLVLGYCVRQK